MARPLADPPGLSCISSGHLLVSFNTDAGVQGHWCIWCSSGAYGWNRDDEITDEMLEQATVTELIPHGDWKGRED